MTTKEYKKEITESVKTITNEMWKVCRLYEDCEYNLQKGDDDELQEFIEWFANRFPFEDSFDDVAWKVDSWKWALIGESEDE